MTHQGGGRDPHDGRRDYDPDWPGLWAGVALTIAITVGVLITIFGLPGVPSGSGQ